MKKKVELKRRLGQIIGLEPQFDGFKSIHHRRHYDAIVGAEQVRVGLDLSLGVDDEVLLLLNDIFNKAGVLVSVSKGYLSLTIRDKSNYLNAKTALNKCGFGMSKPIGNETIAQCRWLFAANSNCSVKAIQMFLKNN